MRTCFARVKSRCQHAKYSSHFLCRHWIEVIDFVYLASASMRLKTKASRLFVAGLSAQPTLILVCLTKQTRHHWEQLQVTRCTSPFTRIVARWHFNCCCLLRAQFTLLVNTVTILLPAILPEEGPAEQRVALQRFANENLYSTLSRTKSCWSI